MTVCPACRGSGEANRRDSANKNACHQDKGLPATSLTFVMGESASFVRVQQSFYNRPPLSPRPGGNSFQSFCSFPLETYLLSLGAVILEVLPKPFMLQGLMSCDAFLWIVDKDLLEQIKKFAVEVIVWWNGLLDGL